MKKVYYIIFLIIIFGLFTSKVHAASSFTTSASQITSGSSFTATISINPVASWNIHMTSTGPVSGCTINQADATVDAMNASKTFSATCTSTGVGTITLTLSGDYTTADGQNYSLSGTKSVTVENATTVATTQAPVTTQTTIQTTTQTPAVVQSTITTTKKVGSSDASLKFLSIEGQALEFSSIVYEYNLTVSSKVETINIIAEANDPKAIVSGLGEISLKTGENKVAVAVTAENGSRKVYTLKITKSEQDNIPSTNLSKLVINDKNIELVGNTFLVGVDDINNFNLGYETSSTTTRYNVVGDKNLKEGINKITLTLVDANCQKNTYTIYAYFKPSEYTTFTNINDNIDVNSNLIYFNNQYNKQLISDSFIKQFKESKKDFIYNVINDEGGLLKSFKFKNNNIGDNAFELKFIKISEKQLTYISNLQKGVEIKTYIDEAFKDNTILKLYSYDQKNNKYKLIDNNIKINNGYVSFVSDGSEQYVLSKEKINTNLPLKEWIIRILSFIIGFCLAFIIFKLTIKRTTNYNSKKKIKNIDNKKDNFVNDEESALNKTTKKIEEKEIVIEKKDSIKKDKNKDGLEKEENNEKLNKIYKKEDIIKEKRKNNNVYNKSNNYRNDINNFKKNNINKKNQNWYR